MFKALLLVLLLLVAFVVFAWATSRRRAGEAVPLLEESLPAFSRWGAADPADVAAAQRALSTASS